ncbi:MAG: FecR family protein [Longimicrobiales bacterium]
MDEIILRVLKGEASPFEEERLRRWRSHAEANEAHFQAMSRIWALSGGGPGTDADAEADDGEVDLLLNSVLAAAAERRGGRPRARGRRIRTAALWGASLAAGLAALAIAVQRAFNVATEDAPVPSIVAASSSTPQTLRLEDGSYVRLAPGSRLDVRFREGRRDVSLRGRAFFAVAPDRSRPFRVQTGGGEVRVLGTRFEVAEGGDGVRTVVVEGRVALSSALGVVEVPAGSVGSAPPDRIPEAEAVADPWALLDWPGGLLVFHDTPLSNVIREVEDHFGLPIGLHDSGAGSRRISASFQEDESFREVVETLCVVASLACRVSPDSAIILSTPGGGP